jgi:hypothetical protein
MFRNQNLKVVLSVLAFALLIGWTTTASSWSAPIDGKLSLESPVTADRLSDDSSMILGSLTTRLAKRWTLTGTAQYNFGDRGALRSQCLSEDKVRGTVAYDLCSTVTVYSYFESRFSLGQDRVVLGAAWKFRVH